jgi:hypothetical protein
MSSNAGFMPLGIIFKTLFYKGKTKILRLRQEHLDALWL